MSLKTLQTEIQERIWLEYKEITQKKQLTFINYLSLAPLFILVCGVYGINKYNIYGTMYFISFLSVFISIFLSIPAIMNMNNYVNYKIKSDRYYEKIKEKFFQETLNVSSNSFTYYDRMNNMQCIFINEGYSLFFSKKISIEDFIKLFYVNSEEMKKLSELKLNEQQRLTLLNDLKNRSQYHQYDIYNLIKLSEETIYEKEQTKNKNLAIHADIIKNLTI